MGATQQSFFPLSSHTAFLQGSFIASLYLDLASPIIEVVLIATKVIFCLWNGVFIFSFFTSFGASRAIEWAHQL